MGKPTLSRPRKSPRLCFRSLDDAQNYARHLAQAGRNWASTKYWDFPKLYTEGKLNIVVNCSLAEGFGNYDFVFSAIPVRSKRQGVVRSHAPTVLKNGVLDSNSRFDDGFMLCSVADFVECPQGRIPSLVRLEVHKERLDLLGQMFVSSVAGEGGVHVSPRIVKGKVSPFAARHSGRRGMIQSRAKPFDDLNDISNDVIRHRIEPDFVQRVKGFRISLFESSVRLRIEVNKRSAFQFAHLLCCPLDSEISTLEFHERNKVPGSEKSD